MGEIIFFGLENFLGKRWIGFWIDGINYIGFYGIFKEEIVG